MKRKRHKQDAENVVSAELFEMDEVNVETAHISVLYSALHTDIPNHFNTREFASGYSSQLNFVFSYTSY